MAETIERSQLIDIEGLSVFLDNIREETDEKIAAAGQGVTYSLSKNSDGEIVLTGTNGTTTKVSDANTTYSFSESNHKLTITGTDGTNKEIQLGDTITKEAIVAALGFEPMSSYTEIDPTVPECVKSISSDNIDSWDNKAELSDIPTTLPASDVYDWAKAENKPTYTASEVGALPSTTAIPSALSDLSDDTTHRLVTDTEKTSWSNKGTYSKPSGGIPKSDLASAVQTSLGKADTALQSFTETDPVFSASAASGIKSSDITNWNAKSEFSGSYNDLTNKPDLTVYSLVSDAGCDLGLSIDPSTYVMTLELKNKAGNVVSTKTLDFPIESMVVGASYKDGKITLTLQSGSTLDVDISSIVGGLVNDTFTIAGIDMKDNITVAELKTALGIPDSYAPTNAQANVIETIKVNNTALTPTSKAVNITVPTKASDIGAMASTVTHLSGDVPTSRTVNGKALSSNITLSASDVGALPDTTAIPTESTVSGWGFTKNTGTYSKPSGGIPKSDLASAVQTSLGKADTALQSHQDISGKMDKASPAGTGSFSMNRMSGSTTGQNSITLGKRTVASGNNSFAVGGNIYENKVLTDGFYISKNTTYSSITFTNTFSEGYTLRKDDIIKFNAKSAQDVTWYSTTVAEEVVVPASSSVTVKIKSFTSGLIAGSAIVIAEIANIITTASGSHSIAEGEGVIASGEASHAEGYKTEARGNYSHTEGYGTIAVKNSVHVEGEYNTPDTIEDNLIHIVGNGTSDAYRSNAHTLDILGNAWYAGDVTATDSNGNSITLSNRAATDETGNSLSVSGTTVTLKNKAGTVLSTITTQDTNTKNTAGSTNTSSKIFLVGATSQASNPTTYSHDTAYVGTDGCLYSGSVRVRSEITATNEPTQTNGDFWLVEY